MSSQFNRGPAYGFSAEVKSKIAQKYDTQKEEELRIWIEDVTGVSCCRKLFILENLTNFIKATTTYGLKPHDIFEANDLFENGNMTQVQTTLLALAGMAKTKGIHSSVDIGVKYAERQERAFDEEKMKAGQCVIGLQMGTNKCASQAGMNAYGTRRHLYDPKSHILPPMDHSTISLQMGTNKGASQVTGMNAYGTRRHLYDPKSHILPPMDHSTISLQMGTNKGASQSGQNFGLGRQIYDAKYCPKGAPSASGEADTGLMDYQDEGYQGYQDDGQDY
uniref:Calponin n=1 Tax=Cyprinus carpio TaxID=7962 RepID=A0A8C1S5Q3_CYPCA